MIRRRIPAGPAGLIAVVVMLVAAGCGAPREAGPALVPVKRYVALGDTFAAAPYTGETAKGKGCRRAAGNYPSQVARAVRALALTDVSCTGADIDAALKRSKVSGKRVDPQIRAVSETTDLVTVQLGAYVGKLYDNIAAFCARHSKYDCKLSAGANGIGALISSVQPALTRLLRKIGKRAPRATVLVVGYPRHIDGKTTCSAQPKMSDADRKTWIQIDERLNLALRNAADVAVADFVDVYAASAGHGICGETPWVRPARTSRSAGVALGPTAAGETAIAGLIHDTLVADQHFDVG